MLLFLVLLSGKKRQKNFQSEGLTKAEAKLNESVIDESYKNLKISNHLDAVQRQNPEKENSYVSNAKPRNKFSKVPTTTVKGRAKFEKAPKLALRFADIKHTINYDVNNKGFRCKFSNCGKHTTVYCETCNVHLCFIPGKRGRNCFKKYHILDEN